VRQSLTVDSLGTFSPKIPFIECPFDEQDKVDYSPKKSSPNKIGRFHSSRPSLGL